MILNGFEYDELSIEYLVSKTLNTQYSKKNEYGCMIYIYNKCINAKKKIDFRLFIELKKKRNTSSNGHY